MHDRPMTTDQALAILTGDVELDEHPSGPSCGVCGVPMRTWWSTEQAARHRRFHEALVVAVAAGAPR